MWKAWFLYHPEVSKKLATIWIELYRVGRIHLTDTIRQI